MNLLQDPWMPVRDAQGRREWITPDRLADPQWRAFDADRPDFNGALAQFAIGLLQTTTPVDSPIEWRELYRAPPTADVLRQWFRPVVCAFELDGDGPRFMQDRFLKLNDAKDRDEDSGRSNSIQNLLIDVAGEGEKVDDNTDHFVKRLGSAFGLCPSCTATAVMCLQVNAPGGGRGYLVSIRGGGPLTTLVHPAVESTLWHSLWLNVMERSDFDSGGGQMREADLRYTFPWLADLRLLQPAGITSTYFEGPKGGPKPTEEERPRLQPSQVHPCHVFWGMPRRLKLDFETCTRGRCGICERDDSPLVRRYAAKNYGLNYKGDWIHPLSPYAFKEQWLPIHPQSDGIGYRHWLAWILGAVAGRTSSQAAKVVTRALALSPRTTGGSLRLWAFGYDMDNMKAVCWHESMLPLYHLTDCKHDQHAFLRAEVGYWLNAAEAADEHLRYGVRDALFKVDPKRGAALLKKLEHVSASFWSATEPAFYRLLQALIERVRDGIEHPALEVRQSWHHTLTQAALRLFDQAFVGAGAIERQNPRRIALAHQQLQKNLHGPKLKQALGLPTETPAGKPARKRGAARTQEAA